MKNYFVAVALNTAVFAGLPAPTRLPQALVCPSLESEMGMGALLPMGASKEAKEEGDHVWERTQDSRAITFSFYGCDDSGSVTLPVADVVAEASGRLLSKSVKAAFVYEMRGETSRGSVDCTAYY